MMKHTTRALCFSLLWLAVSAPDAARAHGLHGHVHVTGWAIENLPEGELRDFFDDPDVFEAALMGAMFPDTGYALGDEDAREYAEYAHWEPFINRFVEHVRTTYGPRYTKDERLVVAFLLGVASHGLQDELFDSTFMEETEQRDGQDQGALDPGTDGFLIQDGHFRLLPGEFVPMQDILPLFQELPATIDQMLIEFHISIVKAVYVNDGPGIDLAIGMANKYRGDLPWASTHYLDATVAGSLRAEILPTGRHMQALWERLHDTFDEQDLVVHTWPEDTRRLRSGDHTSESSTVTLVLGKGIEPNTTTGSFRDANGQDVPFTLTYTHWGGTSRIVRFKPMIDLAPGARYTVTLDAGAQMIDGSTTALSHAYEFQVDCGTDGDPACPAVDVPEPSIDSPITFSPASSGGCATSPVGGASSSALTALVVVALVAFRARRARR